MNNAISSALIILVIGLSAGLTIALLNLYKEKKMPTVEVYASVEIISCKSINHTFFIPEDFYTLEIRPQRGEFWLVATTPRGDVQLMPGVVYIYRFIRQKK